MTRDFDIEFFLKAEEITGQLQNNNFVLINTNSIPDNYDYRHLSMKQKYLTDNKLELIKFGNQLAVIGKFNLFLPLPFSSEIKNILFEYDSYTTLSPLDVRTKNNALLLAYYSGILNEFIGEELRITHTGELPIENYDFFIVSNSEKQQRVSLRNYSSFIDGVFESQNKVVLIISELYKTEDISLKELYIPYLYFSSKTSKEIVVNYMSFSNDIFRIYEVNFSEVDQLNNAEISNFSSYKISNDKIIYDDIVNVLNNVSLTKEQEIPFPQANDFDKIIDLIHLLNKQAFTIDEITSNYGFVERQTNYYTDAAIYLDLIQIETIDKKKVFTLTERANRIVSSRIKNKYLELMECVLEHEAFSKTLKLYFENSSMPSNSKIVEIMKESNVYNIKSESTFLRRASTVQSWIKWIINLPKIYY